MISKNLKIFGISSLLLSSVCFADVVAINQGQVAPFKGYLFSSDKELEARSAMLDNVILKDMTARQEKVIQLYKADEGIFDQRIENYIKQNDILAKENEQLRSMNNWERFGWFALGVVATGLSAWGMSRVVR